MSKQRTVELALPPDASIGDRFRIARVAARLRPPEAASQLGISLKTYQRIEDGTRPPKDDEVIAMARITGQASLLQPPTAAAA